MGAHYYSKDGKLFDKILGKNGNQRAVTCRDAKKLDLVPSVTTVLDMYAKPGLQKWIYNEIARVCFELPQDFRDLLDQKSYTTYVLGKSKEKGDNAANWGSLIHAHIDRYLKCREKPELDADKTIFEYLNPIYRYLDANISGESEKVFVYSVCSRCEFDLDIDSCNCQNHQLGYAGTVDNYSDEGDTASIVRDFKTQETAEGKFKTPYPEWIKQLGGYALATGAEKAENILISSTEPGLIKKVTYTKKELERGKRLFLLALETFYVEKNLI